MDEKQFDHRFERNEKELLEVIAELIVEIIMSDDEIIIPK
jgi:hypothetical protein